MVFFSLNPNDCHPRRAEIHAQHEAERGKGTQAYPRRRSASFRTEFSFSYRYSLTTWVPFPRYAALRSPGMTGFGLGASRAHG
jgi:hypothetical protein